MRRAMTSHHRTPQVNSTEHGRWKYAEFDPTGKQTDFADVNFYELFDLDADPYETVNVYYSNASSIRSNIRSPSNDGGGGGGGGRGVGGSGVGGGSSSGSGLPPPQHVTHALKAYLHTTLRSYYGCKGTVCP